MRLFRYYRNAAIYPSLFVLVFSVIYTILDNHKSELTTDKSEIMMSIVPSLIYLLLMCGLSLTIFLNRIQKLHKNIFWNVLTWFLLPVGYIAMVLIYDINIRIHYDFGFGRGFIYLLIMTLPFIIGLCWTFVKYRQRASMDYTR